METKRESSIGPGGAEPYATRTGSATVTIDRILPGPAERVWAYLTESDKRRQWFASGPMDLRPGGAVALTFRNNQLSGQPARADDGSADDVDHQLNGVIVRCEPMSLLVFRWGQNENASEVTFALSPHGGDTRMVVTHRRLESHGQLLSVSAGWHAHIGILLDILSDEPPRNFWPEHARLAKVYGERFVE